ncbi:MAG: disulfide bond formation protein B [Hyphomicrobiales bacterium]|nr:disulfide bond formation protein B [Hyphomicrobiales bacterium]
MITTTRLTAAMLALAAATIIGALAFEHIGGLAPCPLCLQQRIPYWSGLPLGIFALAAFHWGRPRIGALLMSLVCAGFALGSVLAVYHAGIEWHWWQGPAACSGAEPPTSIDDLLKRLQEPPPPRCDEASWRLMGLSLSGYNAIVSACLSALGAVTVVRALQEK